VVFAMLRGPWPRVTSTGIDVNALEAAVADGDGTPGVLAAAIATLVDDALTAQVDAGCELITDGQVRWRDPVAAVLGAFTTGDGGPSGLLVRSFLDTADRIPAGAATVAQAIPGPFTVAWRAVRASGDPAGATELAMVIAEFLAAELDALRAAGCAVVVVEEPAATAVRSDPGREAWTRAHEHMLRAAGDVHVMLSIAGGDATGLGGRAIAGLPYASVLVDLVAGPDNWYVVRDLPGTRGIVCATLVATPGRPVGDQSPELVWAAQYAASMDQRGLARVGLANSSPLAALSPAEARAALVALGAAARFAVMTPEEALAAGFDERALRTIPGPKRAKRG
jgi:hypothetical protein